MNYRFPLVVGSLLPLLFSCNQQKNEKPNVLFIAVDDLKPELGCYGKDYMHTPNIDRFASQSVLFNNHYVNMPTSGASRYSLLTGKLPKKNLHLSNEAIHREISGQAESEQSESFIHQLRRNDYHTVGIGKISHYADGLLYGYTEPVSADRELPYSWDELLFNPGKWETGWNAFFAYADGSNRQSRKKMVKPYECFDGDDCSYPDGLSAELAIKKLKDLKNTDKPFFMGVGFFKPHLPFNAPKKYWDMYDEDKIPLSKSSFIPENVNQASLHESGEFNQYLLGEEKASLDSSMSDEYVRKLRHAYFACVSYIDAQIGKVLSCLEELGLDENTIVVIWGDHGWHLGDHLVWGKHTIFEEAVRSTLIIRVPDSKASGKKLNEIVSTVDLYPSLMELCQVPIPEELDGQSMKSLLMEGVDEHWRNTAYSYFRKGISVRTPEYRYTKYFRTQEPRIELYDHLADSYENENIYRDSLPMIKALDEKWKAGDTGLFGDF